MFFTSEQKLGNDAKLGVKFYLLSSDGKIEKESGYNENIMFPMASTKKIVIALAVLKKIFLDKNLELTDEITIAPLDLSPGRPNNTLDRWFFCPWNTTHKKTIDQLLTYMLAESDNTSTDALLKVAGGVEVVNDLINDLGISGHKLSYSSKELLAHCFQTSIGNSFSNILRTMHAFLSGYSLQPTEKSAIISEQDVCTPKMMADLLMLLVNEHGKNSWLSQAAAVIFAKMQQCLTGELLIKKGVANFLPHSHAFGSKQGGLGSIRNDTAFLHLHDARWIILSIHTHLSPHNIRVRDEIIADLSNAILMHYVDIPAVHNTAEPNNLSVFSR